MSKEQILLKLSPCLFRQRPIKFTINTAALLYGAVSILNPLAIAARVSMFETSDPKFIQFIGFILCFVAVINLMRWYWLTITTSLKIMPSYLIKNEGFISRKSVEILHRNVQNSYVNQNIIQRIYGVGSVGFSSSGQSNVEVIISGIEKPHEVAAKIRSIVGDKPTSNESN
jgi:uncharacterized membrane protein YdbT with pleckstrin-like domain